MRRLHLLLIALTALLLLLSIAWGLSYLYGAHPRHDSARAETHRDAAASAQASADSAAASTEGVPLPLDVP